MSRKPSSSKSSNKYSKSSDLFQSKCYPNHTRSSLEEPTFKIHQGIYAYRKWALDQFINLKDELAEIEKLEQLKFIQSGIPISITESKYKFTWH